MVIFTIKKQIMRNIALLLLFIGAIEETANAQISIAPEFGLNLTNLAILSSGNRISGTYSYNSPSLRAGISIGGVINYDLNNHIYLEPGLFYEMTGTKVSENGMNIIYNINTIEVPINIEYKFAKNKDKDYYFFGAGLYVADNVSGTVGGGGQSHSLDIGTAAGTDDIKAVDIGIGLNIGRVVKYHYFYRLHDQLGFTNLYPGGNSNNSIKASAFGVTIGYFLYGKTSKKTGYKKN
jgi:hypothetical protein